MTSRYAEEYRRSLADPGGFWGEAARAIDWEKSWDRVLDKSNPPFYRWFKGARLNTCFNALDRHVERGRADQTALIYDSPVTDTIKRFSYQELRDQVAKLAGALQAHGVQKGDRVILYMPMVPEAVMAMLACARIGAIHSVVFGGFAAPELAARLDDAKPRMVLSASCGIEVNRIIPYKPLLDQAISLAKSKPEACLILQRPQQTCDLVKGRDFDWAEECAKARTAPCVPVEATDPLYILYTSGTTGAPKGIVRDNGGHAVALAWSMENVYGFKPGGALVPRLRRGLGGGAQLYLLRAAALRPHHHLVRGQAGRHARRRHFLAGDSPARRGRHVHRAHRLPRDQAR